MQRMNQFDAVIAVVGTPSDSRMSNGREMRKWVYNRASKMHLPYKGIYFGLLREDKSSII